MIQIPLHVEAAFLMNAAGMRLNMIARVLGVTPRTLKGWRGKYGWREWARAHMDLAMSAVDMLARQAALLSATQFGKANTENMTDAEREKLAKEMLRLAERLKAVTTPRPKKAGKDDAPKPEKKEEPNPKDLSLDDILKGDSHAGRIPEDQGSVEEADEGAGNEGRQEERGANLEQHGQQG